MSTRRNPKVVRGFETLEDRVVLTAPVGPVPTLAGSLAILGVIPGAPPVPTTGTTSTQLAKDAQTLQNDLVSLFGKSGVTVSELTALQGDDQAIAKAGVKLDGKALIAAQNELARDVVSGNPGAAHSDFTALFGGKLSQTAIDRVFNDEISILKDSHVTAADLDLIAADNAAIQKDRAALGTTTSQPTPPPPSLGGSLVILGVIPPAPH